MHSTQQVANIVKNVGTAQTDSIPIPEQNTLLAQQPEQLQMKIEQKIDAILHERSLHHD